MVDDLSFVQQIRERYPEGLTGVFAFGGTRMSYILTRNSQQADPGRIHEMNQYADYGFDYLRTLITDFLELGGQNVVVPALSYQVFSSERGQDYAEQAAKITFDLMEGEWVDFYRKMEIDPYLTGIDTLLEFPQQKAGYDLALRCQEFNQTWAYQTGRRKLIWEIAPIPLFSFYRAHAVMGEPARTDLEARLRQAPNLQAMHDLLYAYYARAVYGTDLPIPHFYLGNNRNGDLKLRALLPIAMLCGGPFRLYFTPYPSLLMKRETMRAILEDLAFGKRLRSTKLDYSGQVTAEELQIERVRIEELVNDPESTLGLVRSSNFTGKE